MDQGVAARCSAATTRVIIGKVGLDIGQARRGDRVDGRAVDADDRVTRRQRPPE